MTIVGHCPKCGAPVYAPIAWWSVTPPPSYPSCYCGAMSRPVIITTAGTGGAA